MYSYGLAATLSMCAVMLTFQICSYLCFAFFSVPSPSSSLSLSLARSRFSASLLTFSLPRATWGNANGRQRTACYSASCTRAAPLAAVAASPREQRTALHAASASASASLLLTLKGEPRLRPRARARMPQMANKGSASGSRWKHCSSASCMPARLKAAQQVSRRECKCAPSAPSPLPARKARAPALSRQQFPSEAPRLLPGDQGSHFHQSLAVAGCE